MSLWESVRKKEAKGQFLIVNLKEEPYGEVEPNFARKFYDELFTTWFLWDQHGNRHTVQYNRGITNAIIITGWTKIRTFYALTADHSVLFRYLGNSCFIITVWKVPASPTSFPRFHSQNLNNINHITFEVEMSPYKSSGSQLVNLPIDFAEFLWKSGWTTLKLHDPSVLVTSCKILKRAAPRRSIKLGKGWKTFTTQYPLTEVNRIVFEFGNENVHYVNVRKLAA